ncbi:uncharacterized protein METZ01_LOCUS490168 [marine metagenome]|uniref:Uncharacterized protein n=1 Tax=marine metagenome TaxID=408172 RepID=A0A383CZ20_9ZZZZ
MYGYTPTYLNQFDFLYPLFLTRFPKETVAGLVILILVQSWSIIYRIMGIILMDMGRSVKPCVKVNSAYNYHVNDHIRTSFTFST